MSEQTKDEAAVTAVIAQTETTVAAGIPGDLVSVSAAATATGVNVATIRSWYEKGLIRAWRKGVKSVQVSLAEVQAFGLRPYQPELRLRRRFERGGPQGPPARTQRTQRTERQRAASHARAEEHLRKAGVAV